MAEMLDIRAPRIRAMQRQRTSKNPGNRSRQGLYNSESLSFQVLQTAATMSRGLHNSESLSWLVLFTPEIVLRDLYNFGVVA
jgi:hypothetical protein